MPNDHDRLIFRSLSQSPINREMIFPRMENRELKMILIQMQATSNKLVDEIAKMRDDKEGENTIPPRLY